jgi:hypothetical protein
MKRRATLTVLAVTGLSLRCMPAMALDMVPTLLSGGTADEDEMCAQAGLEAVKDMLK